MKMRTEPELIACCHGGAEVNLEIALGFYSMFGSLESTLNIEQKHEMVTAISKEVFPGVLQTEQTIWREARVVEMKIRRSETFRRSSVARYLVGSTIDPMCKSRYRLKKMSEKNYQVLCKIFAAVPEKNKDEIKPTLGKQFMG